MNFAKNIYDLKGKTILDMKMGQFSNEAVFVTTDGTFLIVEYEFQEDDDVALLVRAWIEIVQMTKSLCTFSGRTRRECVG